MTLVWYAHTLNHRHMLRTLKPSSKRHGHVHVCTFYAQQKCILYVHNRCSCTLRKKSNRTRQNQFSVLLFGHSCADSFPLPFIYEFYGSKYDSFNKFSQKKANYINHHIANVSIHVFLDNFTMDSASA